MLRGNYFFRLLLLLLILLLLHTQQAACEFNPPDNIEIERTWSMIAYGETVGMIRSVRKVDKSLGRILIKDELASMVGIAPGIQMNAVETSWLGPEGLEKYTSTFKETNKKDIIRVDGELNHKTKLFNMVLRMNETDPPYPVEFMKDNDYHWSTAYIALGRLNLVESKKYQKKILDIYHLESRDVEVEYLGMEKTEQGGHTFNCHILRFDYGSLKGTFWLAEDELGYFLVKEHAVATEGPFKLFLDEYEKRPLNTSKSTTKKKKNQDFAF